MKSLEQLCLACGLCCDGTLFDNVRVRPGDNAAKLKILGLPVATTRGKTPVTYFPQPCVALCADRACKVYADRPAQCRAFECKVFKAAQSGSMEFPVALRLVKKARKQADHVLQLLRELGDRDEHRSLKDRFRRTLQRMETEQIDAATGATFAELGQAVHQFDLLAHDKFHTHHGEKAP